MFPDVAPIYQTSSPVQRYKHRMSVHVHESRKSVKATLRDLGSLKVAFTDLGLGYRRSAPKATVKKAANDEPSFVARSPTMAPSQALTRNRPSTTGS